MSYRQNFRALFDYLWANLEKSQDTLRARLLLVWLSSQDPSYNCDEVTSETPEDLIIKIDKDTMTYSEAFAVLCRQVYRPQ